MHGTGFRFMPLSAMTFTSSPVLMCIAGAYPGVTADQILSPQPLPFASPGKWNYHRLTGDAVPTGFVVLPGSELLDSHPDCVAVVSSSEALGLELPDGGVRKLYPPPTFDTSSLPHNQPPPAGIPSICTPPQLAHLALNTPTRQLFGQ